MDKLTLKDLQLHGKRVLMRVDFNVPLENGKISDDSRIVASLPSIQYILQQGASLILMSHLGRPDGKPKAEFSLKPCAKRLSELLKKPVQMAPDCIGTKTEQMASLLQPGEVLLLENLRFHEGEEHPEKESNFTENLAKLGDIYVNDAFGTAHRAHASTALIAKFFPHKAAMGFLMEKEIRALTPLIKHPAKPFHAIIGGAKISTKIGVIKSMLEKVDELFIGGAMAYTFFKAKGISIGDSPSEDPKLIQDLNSAKMHFPIDLVIADSFSNDGKRKVIDVQAGIPAGWQGMDIGPKTIELWTRNLRKAATVFWNGPLGVFEMSHFAEGTRKIALSLAEGNGKVIVGGGDSIAAIQQMGLAQKFAHLSTGGGASLEFLEFGHLPGIEALSSK